MHIFSKMMLNILENSIENIYTTQRVLWTLARTLTAAFCWWRKGGSASLCAWLKATGLGWSPRRNLTQPRIPTSYPDSPLPGSFFPAAFQHVFSLSILFIPLRKGPFTYIDSSRGQMTSEMAIMLGKAFKQDSVLLKTESHEQHCNHWHNFKQDCFTWFCFLSC